MKDLVEVKDMFFLYKRIKKINPNYVLLFNLKTKKYEVHDMLNRFDSKCLTISHNDLNAKLEYKLFVSRRENMKKLFLEIEENNKKLENREINLALEKAKYKTGEILRFANNSSRDLSQNEIKNIIQKMED